MMKTMAWVETGKVPDLLIRRGIRNLLKERLREENRGGVEAQTEALQQFIAELKASPIAINTQEANEQHYEMPTEFFKLVLGMHMKYSSGYWPEGVNDLDASETAMPWLTC